MTQRKVKPSSKKTPLTVRELQTWLDGYCSAHENDWSPTSEQWKLIKGKIFALAEEAPVVHNNVNTTYAPNAAYAPKPAGTTTMPVQSTVEAPSYGEMAGYGSNRNEMVGLSDRPAMINKNGTLVMPSSDVVGGPSGFA